MPRAMDDADIAGEEEEYLRREAFRKATAPMRYQRRGKCYNCGEPTDNLYCDVDCRRDYEKEQFVARKTRGERAE